MHKQHVNDLSHSRSDLEPDAEFQRIETDIWDEINEIKDEIRLKQISDLRTQMYNIYEEENEKYNTLLEIAQQISDTRYAIIDRYKDAISELQGTSHDIADEESFDDDLNEILSYYRKLRDTIQSSTDDTDTFFRRMTSLEISQGFIQGSIAGHDNAIKSITKAVNTVDRENQKLEAQANSIISRLPWGCLTKPIDPTLSRKEIMARSERANSGFRALRHENHELKKKVRNADAEIDEISQNLQVLKTKIKRKSQRMQQESTQVSIDSLFEKKQSLIIEINEHKEELRRAKAHETAQIRNTEVQSKADYKRQQQLEDDSWKQEREVMLRKIRDLRSQIREIEDQSKASMRTRPSSRASSRHSFNSNISTSSTTFDEDTLRICIAKELESLRDPSSPIMSSLEQEQRYKEYLDREISSITKTLADIRDFESETFGQEGEELLEAKALEQRISILQAEYDELTSHA